MMVKNIQIRVGERFAQAIKEIQLNRIKKGTSKRVIGSEKLTNTITRHLEAWNVIKKDLENAKEEEIIKFGNGG